MNVLSDVSNGEDRKVIAIVSHPGSDIDSLKEALGSQGDREFTWQNMPPVHMLGRNTDDEQITYDFLLGRTDQGPERYPDGILVLVNATELERQLYLVSQLIDLRLPVVIGFTKTDIADQSGLSISTGKMAAEFGVPVLDLTGKPNISELIAAVQKAFDGEVNKKPTHWRPSVGLANAYHHLDKHWVFKHLKLHSGARLIEGLRLIGVARAVEEYASHPAYNALLTELEEARKLLEEKNEKWSMTEIFQRTNWVKQIIATTTTKKEVLPPGTEPAWKRVIKSLFTRK